MKCCMFEKIDDPNKKTLSERIDTVGWALFFIMIGTLLFVPKGGIPETTWLIGAGIILIGGNIAKYINGIKVCGCTALLGGIALVAGIGGFFGLDLPIFPFILILIGVSIILGTFRKKQ